MLRHKYDTPKAMVSTKGLTFSIWPLGVVLTVELGLNQTVLGGSEIRELRGLERELLRRWGGGGVWY